MIAAMLVVPRAGFSIEDPWAVPQGCEPLALRRATDGNPPRLATRVALYHDGEILTALFLAEDDGVVATHLRHDDPLWQEDVVELFLAPETLARYFEIEVNPLGTTFDAVIHSPDGVRATMTTDLAWTCDGLFVAVRTTERATEVVIRIPFASLNASPDGEWRGNLFRIDRSHAHGDDYSAWQPTLRQPADFHVTAAFGRIRFA